MRGDARSRVRAALLRCCETCSPNRPTSSCARAVEAALARLERAALAGAGETTLVATLHGLTISSRELALTSGLTIAQPDVLEGPPEGALATPATGAETT